MWDTEIDSKEFIITVPVNVSIADIETAMKKAHRFLTSEDEEDSYGVYGRTPEFLVEYVCEKNGWLFKKLEFNSIMDFE